MHHNIPLHRVDILKILLSFITWIDFQISWRFVYLEVRHRHQTVKIGLTEAGLGPNLGAEKNF